MAEGKINCPYCDKRFTQQADLWMHARTSHKGKRVAHLRPPQEKSLADVAIETERKRK